MMLLRAFEHCAILLIDRILQVASDLFRELPKESD
jgi:hypothetical protein